MKKQNKLSCTLVITLHNHFSSLLDFHKKLVNYLINFEISDVDFKIIYVDDGSKDNTFSLIHKLHNDFIPAKYIQLDLNYGQTTALSVGMSISDSEMTILRSADLQDPFHVIEDSVKIYQKYNCNVICLRTKREDELSSRASSKLFYFLIKLFYKKMPIVGFDYVLLNKRSVIKLSESFYDNRFLQYDILNLNEDYVNVSYTRVNDKTRESSWSTAKKIQYAYFSFKTVLGIKKKRTSISDIVNRSKIIKLE